MKIAYVIINANRREGTSRAILEVAERLAQKHTVDLIARTVEDADLSRITHRAVPGVSWPEVADFQSFRIIADRILRRSQYDIIHSAGPNTTSANVYTIQTVHTVKCRIMAEVGANQSAGIARRLTRSLYDRAVLSAEASAYKTRNAWGPVAYLPVSQGTLAELLANHPVADSLIEVVPNGADLVKFNPDHSGEFRQSIRNRHRIASTDIVAVFSGGDWRRKGLQMAIDALGELGRADVKLLVAGEDPLGDELRAYAESREWGEQVIFAAFQRNIEQYYAAGDLFVFPTAYEAFSLATIEAAASGLPVLMPDVSGARELVGSGEAGQIVARSSTAFATAIGQLIEDPVRLAAMRKSSRAFAERNFSWDAIATSTERVYERLIEQRAASQTKAVTLA